MATKWYLRNTNASVGPTATASTDTDSFPATPANKNTPKDMSATIGAAQTSVSGAYASTVSPSYTMERIFVGPALAAQTLTASGTYTIGIAQEESDNAMHLFPRCFVYVWRSGTGNVKTIVVPTSGPTESTKSERGFVYVCTGTASDFSILNDDRIIVETWWDMRNADNTSYTAIFYYDGTIEPTELTIISDAASYFNSGQTLLLSAGPTIAKKSITTKGSMSSNIKTMILSQSHMK